MLNNVKNSDFLTICTPSYYENIENPGLKLEIGDRVRISEHDLPLGKGNKPQFTQEVFEIVAIIPKKPPRNTIKDKQVETIRDKFHQKQLIRVN